MKALIVALNAKYVHASLAPWYLKGAAREAGLMEEGWQVEILESNINRPAAETADRILEAKPDLLAFCCYIWNMNRIEEILGELEGRLSDCRILLGGRRGKLSTFIKDHSRREWEGSSGRAEALAGFLCSGAGTLLSPER